MQLVRSAVPESAGPIGTPDDWEFPPAVLGEQRGRFVVEATTATTAPIASPPDEHSARTGSVVSHVSSEPIAPDSSGSLATRKGRFSVTENKDVLTCIPNEPLEEGKKSRFEIVSAVAEPPTRPESRHKPQPSCTNSMRHSPPPSDADWLRNTSDFVGGGYASFRPNERTVSDSFSSLGIHGGAGLVQSQVDQLMLLNELMRQQLMELRLARPGWDARGGCGECCGLETLTREMALLRQENDRLRRRLDGEL